MELRSDTDTMAELHQTACENDSICEQSEDSCLKSKPDDEATPVLIPEDTSREVKDDGGQGAAVDTQQDEYTYLQRDGFTSELFKLELKHVPKYASFSDVKKRFLSHGLTPKKIKIMSSRGGDGYAFITFCTEAERDAGIKALNGSEWKGRRLFAKKARPVADPFVVQQKRKLLETGDGEPSEKKDKMPDDDLSPEERLKNCVTPLWKKPYEEQLQLKFKSLKDFMKKLGRTIERNNQDLAKLFKKKRKETGDLFCVLEDIKPSPIMEGYRNKSEFTIGKSLDGTDVVGFRYGKYRGGMCHVGEPSVCRNIPDRVKDLTKVFQDFINKHPWDVFIPETDTGHWRMLMVRTARTGDMMAIAEFHPHSLTDDELNTVKTVLKDYFESGEGQSSGVTCMYFQKNSEKVTGVGDKIQRDLLFGKPYIQEELMDMTFQISPDAFFQVNTPAAEVLYSTVSDWCSLTPSTTVLDICCGTGTIGLTVAKHVKKVVGIDICVQAIEDAKQNAALNGINNVEYHSGKAEDVLPTVISDLMVYSGMDVMAVVDPPRPGLQGRVMHAIRRCSAIRRLVYVSCNPPSAMQNFEDLTRPQSRKTKGLPFIPVRAVPVDLFPDTMHCELVILFERHQPDDRP